MDNKEKTLELLKSQYDIEQQNIVFCKEKETKLGDNPGAVAPKLVLEMVRMDSHKHSHILATMIKLIEDGKEDYLWEYQIDKFVSQAVSKKSIEKHIEIESEMIKKIEKLIENTNNEGLKMMLQGIAEDEHRHHKLFSFLVDRLYKL